jgi:4-carboxymuconolactone decarboxylase
MTEEEMIARGGEFFQKCYGGIVPVPQVSDGKTYAGMSLKMFNDFWGDEKLSFRDKRLIVMGVLAGLGADPSLFEIHARSALGNGELQPEELRAVVLMMLPYVGYPRASPLFLAAEKLLAERAKAAD